jgi:hypothetical protein
MTIQSYTTSRTVIATGVATAGTASGDIGPPAPIVQKLLCTVDFGDNSANLAKTTVSGFTWRSTGGDVPRPVCTVVGRPGVLGVDDEDALLERVTAVVTNVIDGVSFDVVAHAPEGTTGLFEVQIVGV